MYGLILAASVMSAADAEAGDKAAEIALYTTVTLLIFWLAHVYSNVLGNWAVFGFEPTGKRIRHALAFEWPMVAAPILPIVVLLVGAFTPLSERASINAALGLCVAELGLTSWFAARRGGAKLLGTLAAVGISIGFGFAIVLLKSTLH